jgi:tetratricopeptide (TPR) repeat protein
MEPSSSSGIRAGSVLGSYTLTGPLGSGGNASVWRATASDGTEVAVKVLTTLRVHGQERQRFRREYEAVRSMDHPNVVKVFEAGVHEGAPWIVMEILPGNDLEQRVATWQRSPQVDRFAEIERILRGLCAGLHYVHQRGFVHRDIKPNNILLRADGSPVLSDFGSVKATNAANTQLTQFGHLIGTVAFMAPEQIDNDQSVDARADLYSLGAVLYTMLTLRRPIEAETIAGFLARHLTEVPRPANQVDPFVPTRLSLICERLLRKEPSQRYPSALAVLEALDRDVVAEEAPLRGRDAEIGWFARRVRGGPGLVVVSGPPGSGRTSVVGAMAEVARGQGARVVATRGGPGLPQRLAVELVEAAAAAGRASDPYPVLLVIDDLDRTPPLELSEAIRLVRPRLLQLLVLASGTSGNPDVAALADGSLLGSNADLVELESLDVRAVGAMLRDRGVPSPLIGPLSRRLTEAYQGQPLGIVGQVAALVEAGWLVTDGPGYRSARPLDAFRSEPLPVGRRERSDAEVVLGGLPPEARMLAEVLAVMGRPVAPGILAACGPGDRTADGLLVLRRAGVVASRGVGPDELVSFTRPALATVLLDGLPPPRRREHHEALARVLAVRRRRDAPSEVADHYAAAGMHREAVPLYVQAARRAARAGNPHDVVSISQRALRSVAGAYADDPGTRSQHERGLNLLLGDAWVEVGRVDEALGVLTAAATVAEQEGDFSALGRLASSIGKAWYRKGDVPSARTWLERALRHSEPGANERHAALRLLADAHLQLGSPKEAEALWLQGLDAARAAGSRDQEARARRGLAHVRAIAGRLEEAADLLDDAEDLLEVDGDPRVRASVIARSIELDAAAGRVAAGLHRCEQLLGIAHRGELTPRLAEANAMAALVLSEAGRSEDAANNAAKALRFAGADPAAHAGAVLHAARVLVGVRPRDAGAALIALDGARGREHTDDPAAQVLALRARVIALEQPDEARMLVARALARPPAPLVLAWARISIDAALALAAAGSPDQAAAVITSALGRLPADGVDALRLRLLALGASIGMPGANDAARALAKELVAALPSRAAQTFLARPDLAFLR